MGQIIRREFLGSRLYFFVLCITGIGIPIAIIYLLECTVTVVEDMSNPSEFLDRWSGRRRTSVRQLLQTFFGGGEV